MKQVLDKSWRIAMTWRDLLFIHWPVEASQLKIPPPLEIDLYKGQAWIGIVPFYMTDVAVKPLVSLPGASSFPELNVRTYVTLNGHPGVWFFSLDAANYMAVVTARNFFHLPYYYAQMESKSDNHQVFYKSKRIHPRAPSAEFEASYRPAGKVSLADRGSLDHWLTERYCFYASNLAGDILRCDIRHERWPLQPAELEIKKNSMTAFLDAQINTDKPLVHFSKKLNVHAWPLVMVHKKGKREAKTDR